MPKLLCPLLVLAMLVTNLATQSVTAAGETPSIFRHITVGTHNQLIKLGESLAEDVMPLLDSAGEGRYRLRKGNFGGADSIELFVDKAGRVKAIYFSYAEGTEYSATRESYHKSLGKPQMVQEKEDGVQFTRWENASTAFELVKHGSCMRAAMYDRPRSK